MMRSPNYVAVAVRKQSKAIKIKNDPYRSVVARLGLAKIPIIRGMVGFFEMMVIGIKALNFSAQENLDEDTDAISEEKPDTPAQQLVGLLMMLASLGMALGLGLGLFKFLPLAITEFVSGYYPVVAEHFWLYNIIDGSIKISFFVLYIFLISFLPDLKRVFEYHGAEHKAVRAYEADLELTPQNAKKMSRFHPRCGTSFVLVVFVISIIFYTFLPTAKDFWLKLAERIAVLPFIAGISYEFLKWSAQHEGAWWLKAAIAPGMWLQKLTTREPDLEQLEVAIAALKSTLEGEKTRKAEVAMR